VQKTESAKAAVNKATVKAAAKPSQNKATAKPAPKQPSDARVPQVPLREVVTQVLKKMGVPLKASELAEEVLKTGYRTDSTKFVNNVFVILGWMDNVEHVAGEGYRLKRKKVRHYLGTRRRDQRLERELAAELEQSSRALDGGLFARGSSPSRQAVRREQAVRLADALDQLPDDYREGGRNHVARNRTSVPETWESVSG